MIGGLSVLAIIPARGGSKGLHGKNIIDFCGKPLIAWTIAAAHQSKYIDRTILSSDDPKIIDVSRRYGCDVPFERPAELATDLATSHGVVLHAIRCVPDYDLIVLLQPTSPLRTAKHIDEALELMIRLQSRNCIAVSEVSEHPSWMFNMTEQGTLEKFEQGIAAAQRRQDLRRLYIPNGAIYIISKNLVEKSKSLILECASAYEMPQALSVDIDSELDLKVAETIMNHRRFVPPTLETKT